MAVQRALGAIWAMVGFVIIAFGGLWLVLESSVVEALPVDPRLVLRGTPRWGDYLIVGIGIYLLVVGLQMARGAPGTRIVAAFVHAFLGACILAGIYIAVVRTTDTQLVWRAVLVFSLLALALSQFYLAARLSATDSPDPGARSWRPYPVCERCGRLLDERGRCSVHNVPQHLARLVNTATNKIYPVPLPIAVIGTANADVVLSIEDDERYRFISQLHATIKHDQAGESFTIEDLGSRNGTKVAEHDVGPGDVLDLAPGITVKLGNVPFRFDVLRRTQEQLDAQPGDPWDA